MSRIGKLPVTLEKGVTVKLDGTKLTVSGPKGSLTHVLPDGVTAAVEGDKIQISRRDDHRERRSLHGLTRALVQNLVTGVAKGYERKMEMVGVGYKAEVKGKELWLSVGFPKEKILRIPDDLTVNVEKGVNITVAGNDKQHIGNFTSKIRKIRPPEPYKGKGIKYSDEVIARKEGKTNA
ncbi:MAG: 50S ribosomal protein L6 [Deltaproteobacteria bacterium]|nr:50S ribosomal protein L6 [Deltaproteobacteria bacterium]